MKVYLVRHGQSIDASNNITQGDASPLSKEGVNQAKQLAERFRNINVDYVIASPIPRAKQTAEIINKSLNLPIEVDELFIERRWPSEYYGLPKNESKYKEILDEVTSNTTDEEYKYSDEETFFESKERAQKVLDKLMLLKKKNIMVVSHGAFIRTLVLRVVLGTDLMDSAFHQSIIGMHGMSNVGLTVIEYHNETNKWMLRTWNDLAHLG